MVDTSTSTNNVLGSSGTHSHRYLWCNSYVKYPNSPFSKWNNSSSVTLKYVLMCLHRLQQSVDFYTCIGFESFINVHLKIVKALN